MAAAQTEVEGSAWGR